MKGVKQNNDKHRAQKMTGALWESMSRDLWSEVKKTTNAIPNQIDNVLPTSLKLTITLYHMTRMICQTV